MDVIKEATAAPTKAFKWASSNMLAAAILIAVVLLLFIAYDSRNPGKVKAKLVSVPLVGAWATNTPRTA